MKLSFQDITVSLLEAALARGGADLNKVILSAWESGARFDAWTEFFRVNINTWRQAFEEQGLSLETKASSHFTAAQPLPWDFITTRASKENLLNGAKNAGIV